MFSTCLESAGVSNSANMKVDLIAFSVLIFVNLRQQIMVDFPWVSCYNWPLGNAA